VSSASLDAATLIVAVAGVEATRSFLPPLPVVLAADPGDPAMADAVATGLRLAAAITALLALSVAALTQSTNPLLIGAAAIAILAGGFEAARRRGAPRG
jgi:hypothetical protein